MWLLRLRGSHVSTAAIQSLLVAYILWSREAKLSQSREAQLSQSRENRGLLNPEAT